MGYMARYEIPPPPSAPPGSEECLTQEHDRLACLAMLQPPDRCFFCGKPLPCEDLVYWAGHYHQIWLHAACAIGLGTHLISDGMRSKAGRNQSD